MHCLFPPAEGDVSVDGVETRVSEASYEPAIEGRIRSVECLRPLLVPVDAQGLREVCVGYTRTCTHVSAILHAHAPWV